MTNKKEWRAQAPSNIALIKYMGKTDAGPNRPTNSSLSYTLSHLKTFVTLESAPQASDDRWESLALDPEGRALSAIALSEKGQARFLDHLKRIKSGFGYKGSFVVRSANGFPSDCGLASSASSFAALTMAALEALSDLTGEKSPAVEAAADLSRQGSGSSCRSFFSPWALWSVDGSVREVPEIKEHRLLHQVIAVDERKKTVSSSEAHRRVASSLVFQGRPERAEVRVQQLLKALGAQGDWREAYELTWAEFWDMHVLFETSVPSFGYMTADSLAVLEWVRESLWNKHGDGPLVTMDAGPNIHLLYRDNASGREAFSETERAFEGRFRIFSSEAAK